MRLLLIVAGLVQLLSAAKIAIFTFEHSNSQAIYNNKLAVALANGGHDVVLVRPLTNPKLTIQTPKHARIKDIKSTAGFDKQFWLDFENVKVKHMFRNSSYIEGFDMAQPFYAYCLHVCNNTLSDAQFIEALKQEHFDLAFHHHMDFCQMAIIQHLRIKKWILFSSLPPYPSFLNIAGQAIPTSILPSYPLQYGNQMTFLQRTANFISETVFSYFRLIRQANEATELARKYLSPNITPIVEFAKKPNLIMLSADPILEFPTPTTRQVVYIHNFKTPKLRKSYPKELEAFLEKAKRVVLVSFGSVSVSNTMPAYWKDALIAVFKKHSDIYFIWSFDEKINLPPNVYASKWIPQDALLAEEKTVAFITHAGYNSLLETVQNAVPTITVPLFSFGDQMRNALLLQQRGLGLSIAKQEFSREKLDSVLTEILTNNKYKLNAQQYKLIAERRPVSAEQELLYWVDVILNTDIDLNLPNLPLYQLYQFDVLLFIIVGTLLILFVVRKILSWYYWSCCEMAYKEKVKLQ